MKQTESYDHIHARNDLELSLEGNLPDERIRLLEKHLAECAECRAYAEGVANLDQRIKRSLQGHWPQESLTPSELDTKFAAFQSMLSRNQVRTRQANTVRSVGWASLVLLLVAGLAWTIKTLAPIPPQAPAGVSSPEPSAVAPQSSPEPMPSQQPPPQSISLPMAGQWAAVTDWGKLVLTVDESSTSIVRTDFQFSDWTCGSITHTGTIVDASSWLITDNQFQITSTFDQEAYVHMYVNGTFDAANQRLVGTWEESSAEADCSGNWEAFPTQQTSDLFSSGPASQFPGLSFTFTSQLPDSRDRLTIYRQQLSQAVTVEIARQVATQWGVAGGVYASPSEGTNDVIYDVMDGARTMRFLNFPDQFIYGVGYISPDYGSSLMDSGPLPSFDEQVDIARQFLEPLGVLDMPYRTQPLETERGTVAFIPLLDGYPVILEIGVDRGNIGWIDVKVNTPGQVTMVQYSHHDFQPVGDYPILTAEQAWERFTNDTDLQHSRYAVLSPESENTYQSWVRKFTPGQQADIYGWLNTYYPVDSSTPPLVMVNNLPIIGDTTGMSPDNQYDIRFVHVWGQVQGSSTDGVALRVAGWEVSPLNDEYFTGTLTTSAGQTQLSTTGGVLTLIDPPADILDGLQVGVQGVVVEGDPAILNWKFIETGAIPFTYGASSSCGGSGGGGNTSSDANFGGGSFSQLSLSGQDEAAATQVNLPYQPGDSIEGISGRVFITQHLYPGGGTSREVIFSPDPSAGIDTNWIYSLVGNNLSGIDQLNNLPIRAWGQVDRLENMTVYINVSRYETVYPGEQIQAWEGTEQILTLDGQEAILFTTLQSESYVLKSSLDYPPADANVIGRLGDVIEIEGYRMPDRQVGGYTVLQDTAGSAQPDGIADSALAVIWDHSLDPSANPGVFLSGNVTIDTIELAYDAINLERCQASAAEDPNMAAWLYVQPMWVFNGHFEDGRRFIAQVQALPDEYMK